MHSPPLISVVTACYNGSAFLEESVHSAIDNHPSTEVIIVDDGSTDDSLTHAATLARQFAGRVLVVSQANQGPAAARNTGIRLARGKFLCFLDVDDQHAPGFLHAALEVLNRDPEAVAVSCQIELINAHRPVEAWQREAMETSGPCNLVMRTEIMRQIGGFPIDTAFRGATGGEDTAFRKALLQFGKVPKLEHPFLRYRMSPGGYVNVFLDRATLVDGKIHLSRLTREEQDGSIREATLRYLRDVTARALSRRVETLKEALAATDALHHLQRALGMPGSLGPQECYLLNWLARNWPIDGAMVAVASDARALYAMALSGRGIVTAVGCNSAVASPLTTAGVANSVVFRPEDSAHVAASLQSRVRLLYVASLQHDELSCWMPHITRFGIVVANSGTLADAVRADTVNWTEILRIGNLVVFQKS